MVGPGFRKTELWIDFQRRLAPWVENVAQAVVSAPPWRKAWQEESWFAEATAKIDEMPPYKFGRPGLE